MTLKSPRLRWPYPEPNQQVWFDVFEAMVGAMDSSGYASREDRHIIVMGGGYFLLDSDILSWTEDVELLAAITGTKWIIPAGSINLADGEMTYLNLDRAPVTNSTLTLQKGIKVPSTDSALFFCIRVGDIVYFRNGRGIMVNVPEEIWKGGSPTPAPGPGDINATSAGSLIIGDAVYLSGSGTVDKADATSSATVPVIGFAVTAVSPGPGACVIRRNGLIPISTSVLVPGNTYWLNTTAGQITTNLTGYTPGNVVQELGVAFDINNLLISLDTDWTEL